MTRDPLIEAARERFERDTAEHELIVLRDEGLYRHLRFRQQATISYYYDLVTWPGFLAITGDVQAHVFSRVEDMFDFFSSGPTINPGYWAEKLQASDHRGDVRRFSIELYQQQIEAWLVEQGESLANEEVLSLTEAVKQQLLDRHEPPLDQRDAVQRLHDFEHRGHEIYEPYEWTLTEFSGHFLWCLWAIRSGIARYRAAQPSVEVAA